MDPQWLLFSMNHRFCITSISRISGAKLGHTLYRANDHPRIELPISSPRGVGTGIWMMNTLFDPAIIGPIVVEVSRIAFGLFKRKIFEPTARTKAGG
jgi:hypothetical protein